MRNIVRLTMVLVITLSIWATVAAEVEVGGQVRLRGQFNDKGFGLTSETTFMELRTRINISAQIEENATAFVQLQDSRQLGGFDQFGEQQSSALNDGKNVDIHQAYIQVDRVFLDGLGFQAGRFELNLGNQRVFGAVGWSNVGRSWEGGQWWYKNNESWRLSAMWLKAASLADQAYYRDFDVVGLHLDIANPDLELFGFMERNADTALYADDILALERFSVGLYYYREYQSFDFTLNGAYQFGQMPNGEAGISDRTWWDGTDSTWHSAPDTTLVNSEFDIAAFMVNFEAGYSFDGASNGRVAAGIDFTSGDDAPDGDWKAYNNLYYTGHKFRGYMDYFVGSNPEGLMDLMLKGKFDVAEGWTVAADAHYFMTAQDYRDPTTALADSTMISDVGIEIDLVVSTTTIKGIKWSGGASVFLVSDGWANKSNPPPGNAPYDPDPGIWLWEMVTVNF